MSVKNLGKIVLVILLIALIGALGYAVITKYFTPAQDIQKTTTKTDIQLARESLITYFNLLNEKRYAEAIKYRGNGYEGLQNWNPAMDANDHVSLVMTGCEMNGWRCLKIKDVITQKQTSPADFEFVVQFANDNGTLFKRGPCCGATEEEMPTETDFKYSVKKEGGNFQVMTDPVYTP